LATHTPNYGFEYNAARDNYVVNEGTMRIVRRIFRMVGAEGQSLNSVKKIFDNEGVPTPKGSRYWGHTFIQRIITDDVYKPHTLDEVGTFSRHIGSKVEEVEPGKAVCHIDVQDIHLHGNGTLHGGVYASLLDNAMGLAVAALVGLRTATIGLDVHFLGAVREGRITCSAEVVHRTRRIATVEAKVRNGDQNLVAMGTGTFRIFEKRGNPIV
jgi:uncharacterized protein (TIGR00369 family)